MININPLEFIKRCKGLLYDVTIGLAKNYQDKAVHIAKLQAATIYLKGVQIVRQHCVALVGIVFFVAIAAVSIVVIPVAFVLVAPVSLATKMAILGLLGLLFIIVPLIAVNHAMSEEKWMEFTKSKELIDELTNN